MPAVISSTSPKENNFIKLYSPSGRINNTPYYIYLELDSEEISKIDFDKVKAANSDSNDKLLFGGFFAINITRGTNSRSISSSEPTETSITDSDGVSKSVFIWNIELSWARTGDFYSLNAKKILDYIEDFGIEYLSSSFYNYKNIVKKIYVDYSQADALDYFENLNPNMEIGESIGSFYINNYESPINIPVVPTIEEDEFFVQKLSNTSQSNVSTNSYGEPFQVDICDDLEEIEAPFVCPDCIPNENYSEPFWQNETKGFNYYNEKECYYCVITDVSMEKVVAAGYGNNVGEYVSKETPRDDQEDTYLIQALKILGAAYDKTQVTSFYKDSLELYTKIEHLVIDSGSGLTKVKICVQKREFELLPPDESPETDDSVQAGGIEEIELDATEFYGDVARVRAGMLVHKTFYEIHLLKQKGYLYKKDDTNRVPVLSSTIEILRDNLRDFRKDLFHLIREKGYKVNSFKSGLPFANNKVMKIKIKFDNSDPNNLYKIKFISVKPQGCRYRRIYDHRKPPSVRPQDQNRSRLIFQNNPSSFSINPFPLIANFNDINDDFKAIEPPNWHEFMLKYFIPEMALEYGNNSDILTDSNNALSCAFDQFPSFGDFLTASLGSLETVFELLAYEFNKITCAEDRDKAIADFNKRFGGTFGDDFKKQFNNRINPNSGIVSYLLTVLSKGEPGEAIIGSLTFCEVDGLIKLILECLLGGIPFDKALQLLVTKMLKDLSAKHIGKLVGSLPASKQLEVKQKVEQIIGQPVMEPWSQNFAGGVSIESKSKEPIDVTGIFAINYNEEEPEPEQPGAAEDLPEEGFEFRTNSRQRIFDETEIGGRSTYALVTEDLAEASAEQIEQMNVDNKISQVASVILNAYIQAILESMGVDQLIDYMDKLPISPLLRALIGGLFDTCKIPRLNSFKDVGNLMPKFKVSFCDPILSISIPKLPKLRFTVGIGVMFKQLNKMMLMIAKKVFVQLLINFLFKMIKALDNVLCQGLAALARSDGDFLDVFGNLLCDDPNKGKDAIEGLMASFGQIPTDMVPQALSCLTDSFSRSLSKKEMYLISSGQKLPPNRYQLIAEGVGLSCPDVGEYFPDGKAVEDLCDFFPKLLPADQRNLASELAELEDLDNPVCDLICLDQEALSNWDALRQGKLENLGLSPEQAAEEIDKLNNKALEDFDDILTNATSLQDIIADEFNKMLSKDDPCAPSTPWNSKTTETAKFANQLADFVFTPIEHKLSREAAGERTSIMGRILSDTRGNVLNTHNFYANFFLSKAYYKNAPSSDGGEGFFEDIFIKDRGFYPITVGSAIRDEIINEEFEDLSLSYTRNDEITRARFTSNDGNYRIKSNSINEKIETSTKTLQDIVDTRSPLPVQINEDLVKSLLFKLISRSVVSQNSVNVYEELNDSPPRASYETYGDSEGKLDLEQYEFLLPEITEGFLFGYEEETLTKDDIVYKRQDGTTDYDHNEEEEILGVAPTGENRYIFLDPKVHGGTFEKPKIYIKPPKLKGLMKIQKAFLDYDPLCDEGEKVILPFKELKEYHNKLVSELSIDNRLYQEEECRKDLPFDRILSIEGTALLDSLVRASIITHSVDMVLRMIPLMSNLKWKEKNYDTMIEQVLFKKMKKEMLNEIGRSNTGSNKRIRRHRHWNLFLEQVVQAFKRQVELGLITPTQEEADALYACDKVKLFYKYPNRQSILDLRNGNGNFEINNLDDLKDFQLNQDAFKDPKRFYELSLVYDKDKEEIYKNDYEIRNNYSYPNVFQLKKFRLQTKVFAIRTMEEETKILFKRIARQEIDRLMTKMQAVIEPQIESLDLFLFSRDKLFLGSSLSIGDIDSERRYTAGERNSLGQIIEPSVDSLIDKLDLTDKQEEIMKSRGIFIVERFIRRGKSEIELFSQLQRAVSSLQTFRERLQEAPLLDKTKKLSEIFSTSCKFGIRISYIFPDSQIDVLSDVSQQVINREKTYYVNNRSVLPLASFAYDFADETIEQFINPSVSKNNYDTQCLVRNLVKTDDFKELFYNILPLKAPVSLVAAFLYDGFYSSIGDKDGWNSKRAENDAEIFDNLEENSLKGTKKMLQRSFESVYIDQDFDDEMDDASEMNRTMFGFLKNLIPKFKFGLGGKWGKRVVDDLDDCDDPVFKFLRE